MASRYRPFLSRIFLFFSVFSSNCLSKSFTAFGSRISSSRAPLPSLYLRQLLPSFLLISRTSHSSARFVSPSLVAPSPVCFPALYLALASSLSSPRPSPRSPFFRDLRRNIFPRNVRVHLLQVTSVRSIGRVPTHEIRICHLHTFAICEIAFAHVGRQWSFASPLTPGDSKHIGVINYVATEIWGKGERVRKLTTFLLKPYYRKLYLCKCET